MIAYYLIINLFVLCQRNHEVDLERTKPYSIHMTSAQVSNRLFYLSSLVNSTSIVWQHHMQQLQLEYEYTHV